jgi:hypothetical protein
MNILHLFLVWLLMAAIGIINGTFRVLFLQKFFSLQMAHIISSVSAIILIQTVIYFFLRRKDLPVKKLLLMGVIWLGLTVLFEFGFGHFVMGHSWEKLLADYNLFQGRIWSLVLLSVLLGPLIWGRWCKK